jgi:hypothetical protein
VRGEEEEAVVVVERVGVRASGGRRRRRRRRREEERGGKGGVEVVMAWLVWKFAQKRRRRTRFLAVLPPSPCRTSICDMSTFTTQTFSLISTFSFRISYIPDLQCSDKRLIFGNASCECTPEQTYIFLKKNEEQTYSSFGKR